MISNDIASSFYESLRFNHYESGGTCEQRVLVLRQRFDWFLEEVLVEKTDERDFYIEKLLNVFIQYSDKFNEKDKEEVNTLRRFLNGVQHSKCTANENDYILSLKRLCVLINKCSDVAVPNSLNNLWKKQPQMSPKNTQIREVNSKQIKPSENTNLAPTNLSTAKLPVSIILDTNIVLNVFDKYQKEVGR